MSVVFGMAALQRLGVRHMGLALDSVFVGREGEVSVADPWMLGDGSLATRLAADPQPYHYVPQGWLDHPAV